MIGYLVAITNHKLTRDLPLTNPTLTSDITFNKLTDSCQVVFNGKCAELPSDRHCFPQLPYSSGSFVYICPLPLPKMTIYFISCTCPHSRISDVTFGIAGTSIYMFTNIHVSIVISTGVGLHIEVSQSTRPQNTSLQS